MRHSLSSKFQGVLLGSALGGSVGDRYQSQLLGISSKTPQLQPILNVSPHQNWPRNGMMSELNFVGGKVKIGKNASECWRLAVACAQSLIRCNGLDVKDWDETWEVFTSGEYYQQQRAEVHKILHPCEAGVAALPVAMFYHENQALLRAKLMLATEVWYHQNAGEWQTAVLAVSYAIARSLKEKLDPATAIANTITYLGTDNALTELLSQVQILLEQAADLEKAVTHLRKSAAAWQARQSESEKKSPTNSIVNPASFLPIAIAFYCFLSTPEDWRLSVLRTARCGAGQLTCALTGALSGAYNGTVAIPVEWRQALLTQPQSRLPDEGRESSVWGTSSDASIVELANQLFAVWAGVCTPDWGSQSAARLPVVTAPYVIRAHL